MDPDEKASILFASPSIKKRQAKSDFAAQKKEQIVASIFLDAAVGICKSSWR
jgi:hypothetical protein